MSQSKLKLNEPYISIILIQSAAVWTVFHSICNVIHRLLCQEFWSQGIWLRPGCRSSGSLPVKPEASTHLRLTSALWYHRFQTLVNIWPLLLCPFTAATGKKQRKKRKHCFHSADFTVTLLFLIDVLNLNTDVTLCVFQLSWLWSRVKWQ